jgi:glycosidase
VRTPMQWTSGKNGGFSTARPSRLPGPVVEGGFAPEHVNVEAQRREPDSLLSFMTLLVQRYRECPELGWGAFEVIDQPHPSVLAHRCVWDEAQLVAVHNLSPEPLTVPLTLPDVEQPVVLADLLCDGEVKVGADGDAELVLEGYGFRWLRVIGDGDRRLR